MKLINSTIQFSLLVPFHDPAKTQARAIRLRIPMPFVPRVGESIRFRSSMLGGTASFKVRSVEHVPYALDGKVLPASVEVDAVLVSPPCTFDYAGDVLKDVLRVWCWDDQPIVVLRRDGSCDVRPDADAVITVEMPS
jgi:hypothetical protein